MWATSNQLSNSFTLFMGGELSFFLAHALLVPFTIIWCSEHGFSTRIFFHKRQILSLKFHISWPDLPFWIYLTISAPTFQNVTWWYERIRSIERNTSGFAVALWDSKMAASGGREMKFLFWNVQFGLLMDCQSVQYTWICLEIHIIFIYERIWPGEI